MKEWIKKIKGFIKAYGLITLSLVVIASCSFSLYNQSITSGDAKGPVLDGKGDYTVLDGDKLFSRRDADFKDVTHVIVVAPSMFSDDKHVLISHAGKSKAELFMNVNAEGFALYRDTYLKTILEAHTSIDFRYVNSLAGVGARLGLKNDPTGVIAGETAKDTLSGLGKMLSTLVVMIIMIALLMRMQSGSMTNNLEVTMHSLCMMVPPWWVAAHVRFK